jgi:hypothetical protein
MPDRLEQMLREAAFEVEFPPTPDLAAVVRSDLGRPRPYRPPLRRVLVLAALTVLMAAATVFAASPGARDAVLDFFGIDGASVERVPTLPDAPPPTTAPIGDRVSLDEARRRAGFEIIVPRNEPPARVHLSERVPGGAVSFAAGDVTVTELRANVERELLRKLVSAGTRVERLRIGSDRALWLVGRPHVVFLVDADGEVVEESLRQAGNVLLFERGGVVVRIEGASSRAAAVSVARSLG